MTSIVLIMKSQADAIRGLSDLIDYSVPSAKRTDEFRQAQVAFGQANIQYNLQREFGSMVDFVGARFQFVRDQKKFMEAQYELLKQNSFFKEDENHDEDREAGRTAAADD